MRLNLLHPKAIATQNSGMYEKPSAGIPSPQWRYRGPAAETAAKRFKTDTTTTTTTTTNTTDNNVSFPASALYEKEDAGVPSPAWQYRGPEAERAAVAAYTK